MPTTDEIKTNALTLALLSHAVTPSTQPQQLQQSLLRPTASISVRRIGRDARPLTANEISQYQFLIRNNGNSTNNNTHISSNSNNWQAAIRLRNTNSLHVTQQMRNLSLRNSRREIGLRTLAMRDFRNSLRHPLEQRDIEDNMPQLNQEAQNYSRYLTRLYRCAIVRSSNPADSIFLRNGAPMIRGTISNLSNRQNQVLPPITVPSVPQLVPNIIVGSNHTNQLPIGSSSSRSNDDANPTREIMNAIVDNMATINRPQLEQTRRPRPVLPRPVLPRPSSVITPPPLASRESIQSLFNAFNEMFVRNHTPAPRAGLPLIEFTGIITQDLAEKIAHWLITEHQNHTIIRQVFLNSTTNARGKVRHFLQRCGVQMQSLNGVYRVKRDQPFELQMIMTYMLHASGYSNNYFFN